jgi:hypothetical protein
VSSLLDRYAFTAFFNVISSCNLDALLLFTSRFCLVVSRMIGSLNVYINKCIYNFRDCWSWFGKKSPDVETGVAKKTDLSVIKILTTYF